MLPKTCMGPYKWSFTLKGLPSDSMLVCLGEMFAAMMYCEFMDQGFSLYDKHGTLLSSLGFLSTAGRRRYLVRIGCPYSLV